MQGELTCGKSTSSRFIFLGASDSHGNGSLTQGKHPRLTLALCAAAAASFSLALEPSLRACQDMACSLMSTCACIPPEHAMCYVRGENADLSSTSSQGRLQSAANFFTR
jgi:hypothetical protein